MIDILGRAIHDGDIVVAKGTSYGGSQKGMEVGVAIGNSIHTLTCNRNPRDLFLVMNPSKYELDIKEKILSARDKKLKATRNKAKEKSKKEYKVKEPGLIFMTSMQKKAFVYMGYKKVESYADDNLIDTKEGHLYIELGYYVDKNEERLKQLKEYDMNNLIADRRISSFHGQIPYDFEILKGHKVIEKELGRVVNMQEEYEFIVDCECFINGKKPYNKLKVKILNA